MAEIALPAELDEARGASPQPFQKHLQDLLADKISQKDGERTMVGKFRNNSNVCHRSMAPTGTRILHRNYDGGCHDSDTAWPPPPLTGSPVLGEKPGCSRSGFRLPRDSDAQPRMGYSKSTERDLDRKGVSVGV